MCRYRYFYFGRCGHCETVLDDFCKNATPFGADDQGEHFLIPRPPKIQHWRRLQLTAELATLSPLAVAIACADSQEDFAPLPRTISCYTIVGASPAPASLPPTIQRSHSSLTFSEAASEGMSSSLGLFPGSFRQWMTNSPSTKQGSTIHVDRVSVSKDQHSSSGSPFSPTPPPKVRDNGIRTHTDESFDLPKSNDILQHLAESSRDPNHVQNVGTDNLSVTSYGSVFSTHSINDVAHPSEDHFVALEADIDTLKEEIKKLREEAAHGRNAPQVDQELITEQKQSTYGNGINQQRESEDCASSQESAAARLQRMHEQIHEDYEQVTPERERSPAPPSPLDFPALGVPGVMGHGPSVPTSPADTRNQRKISYAHAAIHGMTNAIDRNFTMKYDGLSDAKTSGSTSDGNISKTGTHPSMSQTSGLSETHVSPTRAHGSVESESEEISASVAFERTATSPMKAATVSKSTESTPRAKSQKQAPHFAQPTKAFARKSDATLRSHVNSSSPSSPVETSPTKSARGKDGKFGTEKLGAQRQQKRTSLPGDWFADAHTHREHTVEIVGKTSQTSATPPRMWHMSKNNSPQSSSESPQPSETQIAGGATSPVKQNLKETKQEQRLRKKTSSYMAPTAAAIQRSVASPNLAQEHGKRSNKPTNLRINTEQTNQLSPDSLQADSAVASDMWSTPRIPEQCTPDSTLLPPHPRQIARAMRQVPRQTTTPESSPPKTSPFQFTRAWDGAEPRSARLSAYFAPRSPALDSETDASSDLIEFGDVSNTKPMRRTSQKAVLNPIMEALDRQGLLSSPSMQGNSLTDMYRQARGSEAVPNGCSQVHEGTTDVADEKIGLIRSGTAKSLGTASESKTTPPHIRKARTASEERSLATSSAEMLPQEYKVQSLDETVKESNHRVSSLRANAKEFTPTVQQTSCDEDVQNLEVVNQLRYYSKPEWLSMPKEVKWAIKNAREWMADAEHQPYERIRPYSEPMPQPSEPIGPFFDPMQQQSIAEWQAYGPTGSCDDEIAQLPVRVRAGQTLKPMASCDDNTWSWLLRDIDGRETPVKLGRAPQLATPSPPNISPTSSDTSPPKTPNRKAQGRLGGWSIGSAFSRSPYRWTGGDGKEIRFTGYGPHAESEVNSIVNFNYGGQTASFAVPNSRFVGGEKENSMFHENRVPRSRRQWAQSAGYQKAPCGDMEIIDAVEIFPGESEHTGFCHECLPHS